MAFDIQAHLSWQENYAANDPCNLTTSSHRWIKLISYLSGSIIDNRYWNYKNTFLTKHTAVLLIVKSVRLDQNSLNIWLYRYAIAICL